MSVMPPRRAAFLDRDGVINRVPASGHVSSPYELEVFPDAPVACRILIEKGFEIVVVTNQGGIARGYYTMDDYAKVNNKLLSIMCSEKIEILDVFFSPYHPACPSRYPEFRGWRKPAPGMMFEAGRKHGISLPDSILVGDMESDLEAGKTAGVGRIFFIGSEDAAPVKRFPFQVCSSLLGVAEAL